MSSVDWTTANQRLLVAEFARLKARLTGRDAPSAEQELSAAREALPSPAAIDVVADAFGLSDFERDVLLLCAGVEMDGALAEQCAELDALTGQPGVTFGLALARLADPHWSALTPVRPLRMWRLVEARDERALTTSRVSIDERVMHYLAGVNYLDRRLRALAREHSAPGLLGEQQARAVAAALGALETGGAALPVVQLHGDDSSAHVEIARTVAQRLGLRLHVIRGTDLSADAQEADALSVLWSREAALLGSALLVQSVDADPSAVRRFVIRLAGVVFVSGPQITTLDRRDARLRVDRPMATEQKQMWTQALGEHVIRLNGSLDAIATQYRVGTDVMSRTAEALRSVAGMAEDAATLVQRACRDSGRQRLDDLAQRVEPVATWNDLVLPDAHLATLRQIAAHVRQRLKVFGDWGFAGKCARGQGISVLFTGESGTGKTMAAEVLANELRLDLYRIDLASMVSKYIGETEKNLRRVFDAAEDSGAILLFDEADALFGKRSEVKDSHDRYANIEVSYLLQRMEDYRGLAILTTNLKGALDTAFQRRLRFVVPFPFPDQALRERIWRGVFPANVPLDRVDLWKLAQLNVSGGNIRNIALNAAFIAADSAQPLGMPHLLSAARAEAAKRERPFSENETRGWA
jgi:hypothetical protein